MCNTDKQTYAYEGQSKSSQNSLTLTVWCIISSYLLGRERERDRVAGHFCMQVFQRLRDAVRRKRNDKWQGRGFCIMTTHRATHRLLFSNYTPNQNIIIQPPYSQDLAPSYFGCSQLWKWASRRHVSQPWNISNRTWRPNFARSQKAALHWCFQ